MKLHQFHCKRKSTLERGELYLKLPDPRLKKIYWLISSSRKLLRARCTSSYASTSMKKHTAYFEFLSILEDNFLPTAATCDCKNGLGGNCAHIAALLLKFLRIRDINSTNIRNTSYIIII